MNTPDRRMRVLLFLRLGSLIWALLGFGITAIILVFRTANWIGLELWPYGMPAIFTCIAFIGPGALIAWFSQRIANWMVPLGVCPQCGYTLSKDAAQCSECGTKLS